MVLEFKGIKYFVFWNKFLKHRLRRFSQIFRLVRMREGWQRKAHSKEERLVRTCSEQPDPWVSPKFFKKFNT